MGRGIGRNTGRLTPEQAERLAFLREWVPFRERSAGQYDTMWHDELQRLEAAEAEGEAAAVDATETAPSQADAGRKSEKQARSAPAQDDAKEIES